jgi:uncharacterized protein (DUF736 family)
MAIIGTFTQTPDGFAGVVRTLTLNVKATIRPCDKDHDRAPDYRLFANAIEFGAAWKKISAAGTEYLSCKLDDPGFAAPLYSSLVASDDGERFSLLWSR